MTILKLRCLILCATFGTVCHKQLTQAKKPKERPRNAQGLSKDVLEIAGRQPQQDSTPSAPTSMHSDKTSQAHAEATPSNAGTPPGAHELKPCNPYSNQTPTNTAAAAGRGSEHTTQTPSNTAAGTATASAASATAPAAAA